MIKKWQKGTIAGSNLVTSDNCATLNYIPWEIKFIRHIERKEIEKIRKKTKQIVKRKIKKLKKEEKTEGEIKEKTKKAVGKYIRKNTHTRIGPKKLDRSLGSYSESVVSLSLFLVEI